MTFKDAAHASAEERVPAFTSTDYTLNGLTAIARLSHVEGWKAALVHIAAQEPTDAEVEASDHAYWAAYTKGVRDAPSNHNGQGITESDARRAGQAARRAAIMAALNARKQESLQGDSIMELSSASSRLKEEGALEALNGLIMWLRELGEKHPSFASSTGLSAMHVERYLMDNFKQEKQD